jgi:hypothetical protein
MTVPAADLVLQSLNGAISKRLNDGWYPSSHDPETGEVRHDRHVLIWVRNYEHDLRKLANLINSVDALPDELDHSEVSNSYWFGWRDAMRQVKAILREEQL